MENDVLFNKIKDLQQNIDFLQKENEVLVQVIDDILDENIDFKLLRKKKKLTLVEVANLTGYSSKFLSLLENGNANSSMKVSTMKTLINLYR